MYEQSPNIRYGDINSIWKLYISKQNFSEKKRKENYI